MAKKKTLPSNDFIESKKDDFKNLMEQVASGEVNVTSKRETAVDKLMLVKDELLLLKDKNIPYTVLCKILEDNLDLKVSEQTLRAFCQSRLGFPKKKRSTKKEVLGAATDLKFENKDDSYDASKALSNEDVDFE